MKTYIVFNLEILLALVLLIVVVILATLLVVMKFKIKKLKRNQEFDYNFKRFIIDSLNNLQTQYQELFNGMRMVITKVDDIDIVKKLENLNSKVNKLSRKVNSDYKELIKEEFDKKELEKLEEENIDV